MSCPFGLLKRQKEIAELTWMVKDDGAPQSPKNPSQHQALKNTLGVEQRRTYLLIIDIKKKTEDAAKKSTKRTQPCPELQQIYESLPGKMCGMIEHCFDKMSKKERRKQGEQNGVIHIVAGNAGLLRPMQCEGTSGENAGGNQRSEWRNMNWTYLK